MKVERAETGPRRFNVGDGLILIAAIGLGLFTLRDRIFTLPSRAAVWLQYYHRFADLAVERPIGSSEYRSWVRLLGSALSDEPRAWLTASLFAMTPAQVVMRLRWPRPAWPILVRQPGFVACLAALIGFCFEGRLQYVGFPFLTAAAVLLAWGALLGLRRWESEPSWIDRLGRMLGIGWIAAEFWAMLEQALLS
jgi:hypothetical protein